MPSYNPYMSPYNSSQYNRLASLEQQQFAAQQAAMNNYGMGLPSQAQNMIKGRPVVSMEEARAAQIDLDGSMFVFTDVGNKKIYTKQINLDGTATLNTYALVNDSNKSPEQTFVTRNEMENALAAIRKELLERSNLLNAEQYQSIPNVNGVNGQQSRDWQQQQQQSNASSNGSVREQPTF